MFLVGHYTFQNAYYKLKYKKFDMQWDGSKLEGRSLVNWMLSSELTPQSGSGKVRCWLRAKGGAGMADVKLGHAHW